MDIDEHGSIAAASTDAILANLLPAESGDHAPEMRHYTH
jgi:hypothetical protein